MFSWIHDFLEIFLPRTNIDSDNSRLLTVATAVERPTVVNY